MHWKLTFLPLVLWIYIITYIHLKMKTNFFIGSRLVWHLFWSWFLLFRSNWKMHYLLPPFWSWPKWWLKFMIRAKTNKMSSIWAFCVFWYFSTSTFLTKLPFSSEASDLLLSWAFSASKDFQWATSQLPEISSWFSYKPPFSTHLKKWWILPIKNTFFSHLRKNKIMLSLGLPWIVWQTQWFSSKMRNWIEKILLDYINDNFLEHVKDLVFQY